MINIEFSPESRCCCTTSTWPSWLRRQCRRCLAGGGRGRGTHQRQQPANKKGKQSKEMLEKQTIKFSIGISQPQSSPPSLQLIWRATFCTTELTFFSLLIVFKLITWLGTGFSTQHSFFTPINYVTKSYNLLRKHLLFNSTLWVWSLLLSFALLGPRRCAFSETVKLNRARQSITNSTKK